MELLLLFAIAYASARGVESILNDTRASYNNRVADKTLKEIAKGKGDGGKTDPTAKGGTFSSTAAAPRTASLGTKTAAGIATGVEMGATFWKSFYDGYREAWPTARAEARKRMAERAGRRKAKQAEAAADQPEDAVVVSDKPEPPETPQAEEPKAPAPTAPAPADATSKPALVLVKAPAAAPAPTGDTVSIPEVRTLDGLINALGIVKGQSLMRAEEAAAVAADDAVLASRLDVIAAELAGLEVDAETLAQVTALQEKIAAQSEAAQKYGDAAQNAADLATGAADAAYKHHGGIAEAVQSAPIPAAAQAGYYNR